MIFLKLMRCLQFSVMLLKTFGKILLMLFSFCNILDVGCALKKRERPILRLVGLKNGILQRRFRPLLGHFIFSCVCVHLHSLFKTLWCLPLFIFQTHAAARKLFFAFFAQSKIVFLPPHKI
jgi:hypothetical protein